MSQVLIYQWIGLLTFGLGFLIISPFSKTRKEFFNAVSQAGNTPNFWVLTSSLVISWIFAKSITNAANLGLLFGIVGGLGYAVYYLSFITGGLIIYQLRVKGGFKSIHQFLESKYGVGAILVFSFLVGIRLFNEVWSNSMVIGSYFGEIGSGSYYLSILVFTVLTLAYVLKGGLQSSLLTDFIQMIFFAILLIAILILIFPSEEQLISNYLHSGTWNFEMGLNLVFVALIQIFSYPFHDSVLTDRGFISSPQTTLKSYLMASLIGFICIVLFSFVGIYASSHQLSGQAAVEVSKSLGIGGMLVMNFIMITSAASTLDSAFASFSKLAIIDLKLFSFNLVHKGRVAMVFIAVIGTIPVFLNPEILSATTLSGTMVIGLAPVFLCWKLPSSKWSFYLPVLFGMFIGISLALGYYPSFLHFTHGKYADVLSANLIGSIGCFVLFFIPMFIKLWKEKRH